VLPGRYDPERGMAAEPRYLDGFLSVCLCAYAPVQKTLIKSNVIIAQNCVFLVIFAPEGSVFLDKNSPCYKRRVRGLRQRLLRHFTP